MAFMLGSSLYKDGQGFCQILQATMIGGVHVIVMAQHMSLSIVAVWNSHLNSLHRLKAVSTCRSLLTPPLDNKILQSNSKQKTVFTRTVL